jgi:uncharacterized protein YkwD
VSAPKLLTRLLPVAAVAAGLLMTAPAADAAQKQKGAVTATVALGDKRPVRAYVAVACQNGDLLPSAQNLELVRAAILCLHNQVRGEKGLPALRDNAKLRKAAVGHSSAMVSQGYFDHSSPSGDTFVDRVLSAGYAKRNDGWTLGENLAWGTGDLSSPAGVMQSWMNSAGHKSNILKRAYREVGIGIRLGVPSDAGVGATITADFGVKL